jgi:hypothetical protein
MAAGDVAYFEKLFPKFFLGALMAFDELRILAAASGNQANLTVLADPISDLTSISGYAKLFSELDNQPFWKIVDSSWNDYLSQHSNADGLLNFIVRILALAERTPTLTGGAVEQTTWEQAFTRILRDRGLLSDYIGYRRDSAAIHPSPYVRAIIAGRGMLSGHAGDLFVAICLLPRVKDPDVRAPTGATAFAEELDSESSASRQRGEDDET